MTVKKSIFRKKRFYILSPFILFILYLIFSNEYIDIAGNSMHPTIKDKDIIQLARLYDKKPKVNDVVVFNVYLNTLYNGFTEDVNCDKPINFKKKCFQKNKSKFIKRIVAVEGDSVEIKNKKLYINGKENILFNQNSKTSQAYLKEVSRKGNIIKDEYFGTVLKDEYFVIGDNIMVTKDSRKIGAIKLKDIIGIATKENGSKIK
jgi:signal peptidase I